MISLIFLSFLVRAETVPFCEKAASDYSLREHLIKQCDAGIHCDKMWIHRLEIDIHEACRSEIEQDKGVVKVKMHPAEPFLYGGLIGAWFAIKLIRRQ